MALMGTGFACGAGAARGCDSGNFFTASEDVTIDGATGILLNVTGGPNLGLQDIHTASTIIQESADEDAEIIFGAVIDEQMGDQIKVTVIATGFDQPTRVPATVRSTRVRCRFKRKSTTSQRLFAIDGILKHRCPKSVVQLRL